MKKYFIALCLQGLTMAAVGQPVLFDFDNAPLHAGLPVSITVNGITAQLKATGQGFSIQDANVLGFTPQGFSGLVVYPNSINLADLLVKFDTRLTDFSIMYACQELGCDDAATMKVTAYLNGSLVGTNTKTAAIPGTWPVDVLSCSFAQGFDSVVIHYDQRPPTCQDYGTIFMADNMIVTPWVALPVQLVYFTTEAKGNDAVLQWKSAEEIGLDRYIVQHSGDGIKFHDLAIIYAAGSQHSYNFIHRNISGVTYYRLKMTDLDGSWQVSATSKLSATTNNEMTIVPNPANNYLHIYYGDSGALKTIRVLSVSGVLLKTISNYTSDQVIFVGDLSNGMYIIHALALKDGTSIRKFFLKM